MSTPKTTWLQQSLINLDLMTDKVYQSTVSDLLDEQPYLMGFLFNMEEEFDEAPHELLIRATLAFYRALRQTGLMFEIVKPDLIERVFTKKIDAFNNIDREDEAFDETQLFETASSPESIKGLLNYIDENTRSAEFTEATRNNMLLILSALVELFENAATIPGSEENAMES